MAALQDPDARDRHGNVVVVAVGAHYRPQAITREDLMLHIVNVRPFLFAPLCSAVLWLSFTLLHAEAGPAEIG